MEPLIRHSTTKSHFQLSTTSDQNTFEAVEMPGYGYPDDDDDDDEYDDDGDDDYLALIPDHDDVVVTPLPAADYPGGSARQNDEDTVVYVAIGTIAAAIFVGGLIFLIILNVRRSAAMAAKKEKQVADQKGAYSTIPTSAMFTKQATSCGDQMNNGTNLRKGNEDQTDLSVRRPLIPENGPYDNHNQQAESRKL